MDERVLDESGDESGEVEALCPLCKTWQWWIAFVQVDSAWPNEWICEHCADAIDAENEMYGDHPYLT